jgi:hypothetical protein
MAKFALSGGAHVRNTFLRILNRPNTKEDPIPEVMKVQLPNGPGNPPETFTMEELGIGFAVIMSDPPIEWYHRVQNPFFEGAPGTTGYGSEGMMAPGMGLPGMPSGLGGPAPAAAGAVKPKPKGEKEAKEPAVIEPPTYSAPRYTFVVQFCWQEQLLTDRLEKRKQPPQGQAQPGEAAPTGQPVPAGQPAPKGQPVAAAGTGG